MARLPKNPYRKIVEARTAQLHKGTAVSRALNAYCRAVLESDPNLARIQVKNALDALNETLNQPLLTESERMAIASAIHYLLLIERHELRNVS